MGPHAILVLLTLAFWCKESCAIRCYQAPTLSLIQRARAQGFYAQMVFDNPEWTRLPENEQTWTTCPAQERFGHSYWWQGIIPDVARRRDLLLAEKRNILRKGENDFFYSRFASMDRCTLDCGGLGASSRSMSSTSAENIGKVCLDQDCKECDKHPAGCVRCEDLYSMGVANPFNSPVSVPQEGVAASHTCEIFGDTISDYSNQFSFIGPPHFPGIRTLPPKRPGRVNQNADKMGFVLAECPNPSDICVSWCQSTEMGELLPGPSTAVPAYQCNGNPVMRELARGAQSCSFGCWPSKPKLDVDKKECKKQWLYNGKTYTNCTNDVRTEPSPMNMPASSGMTQFVRDKNSCRSVNLKPDRQCVFPFTYKGKSYDACTTAGSSLSWEPDNPFGAGWCATTANYDSKNWEYCWCDKDRAVTGEDSNGCHAAKGDAQCVFPFIHNGKNGVQEYKTCTDEGRPGKPWCSTVKILNDIDLLTPKDWMVDCVCNEPKRKAISWCSTVDNYDTDGWQEGSWRECNYTTNTTGNTVGVPPPPPGGRPNASWYGPNALDLVFKASLAQENYAWCKSIRASVVCGNDYFSKSKEQCESAGCCKWVSGSLFGGTCSPVSKVTVPSSLCQFGQCTTGKETCPGLSCTYPAQVDKSGAQGDQQGSVTTLNNQCYNEKSGWSSDPNCNVQNLDSSTIPWLGGSRYVAPATLRQEPWAMKTICGGNKAYSNCGYQFCGKNGCNNWVQLNSAPQHAVLLVQIFLSSMLASIVTSGFSQ